MALPIKQGDRDLSVGERTEEFEKVVDYLIEIIEKCPSVGLGELGKPVKRRNYTAPTRKIVRGRRKRSTRPTKR